ncbi:GGDEF domain-containing protein, partial [Pseudomonas juntendi]|uniref:GGDEF domain-containing protein n=1 Tax=Pseudomonas juntendi TaxID=2666183 RepID=UPI00137A8949
RWTRLVSAWWWAACCSDARAWSSSLSSTLTRRRSCSLLCSFLSARAARHCSRQRDALTNLVNRRGFNQLFAERLAEHLASESRLAVMFLDIDHFKRINDSLSHHAGDELLKVIANDFKAATPGHDLVARFGGDGFCVVTSLTSLDEARHL